MEKFQKSLKKFVVVWKNLTTKLEKFRKIFRKTLEKFKMLRKIWKDFKKN